MADEFGNGPGLRSRDPGERSYSRHHRHLARCSHSRFERSPTRRIGTFHHGPQSEPARFGRLRWLERTGRNDRLSDHGLGPRGRNSPLCHGWNWRCPSPARPGLRYFRRPHRTGPHAGACGVQRGQKYPRSATHTRNPRNPRRARARLPNRYISDVLHGRRRFAGECPHRQCTPSGGGV